MTCEIFDLFLDLVEATLIPVGLIYVIGCGFDTWIRLRKSKSSTITSLVYNASVASTSIQK